MNAAKRGLPKGAKVLIAVLVVALVVATAVLSWDHWLRYDDVADVQGTWAIDGSDAAITIDASSIQLTDDVSYGYTLDTFAKTIKFTYADSSGTCSYAFSPERDALVITEDTDGSTSTVKLVRQGSSAAATEDGQ